VRRDALRCIGAMVLAAMVGLGRYQRGDYFAICSALILSLRFTIFVARTVFVAFLHFIGVSRSFNSSSLALIGRGARFLGVFAGLGFEAG
jgi:hypothetical protein